LPAKVNVDPRQTLTDNRNEDTVAKGQMRSNREKKKPKAEKNKNKAAPAASTFSSAMQAAGKGGGPKKN
jgi:hypothetical protein